VAILDRRGVGLSDRLTKDLPPLEVLIGDVLAVAARVSSLAAAM
jgi:hypothetical protein